MQLRRAYRAKELTALEITDALLDRIARLDPSLRSFVTVTADTARREALEADRALDRGDDRPLLGIPFALKDNIATAGVLTSAGSRVLADNIPARDAWVTTRLRDAGAVLVGKSTLHEFAYGWPVRDGPLATGRNPWDPERIPGGSSSGSATAVAAGLVPCAIGTDTGGSIRAPASSCGIVGLKPTNGAINTAGVIPVAPELDCVGPMCRSVDDVALLFNQLTVGPQAHVPNHHDLRDIRIGVPSERMWGELVPAAEITAAIAEATDVLVSCGAMLRTVQLPTPSESQAIVNPILSALYASHRATLHDRPDLYTDGLRHLIGGFARYTAGDVAKAKRARSALIDRLNGAFADVDAIVMPVDYRLTATFDESERERAAATRPPSLRSLWNLVGQPAISLPCGFAGHMPIGMQIAARANEEAILFRVAGAYEFATDWHRRHPPL